MCNVNDYYISYGASSVSYTHLDVYKRQGSNLFFYMILMWVYWRKNKITWIELAAMLAGSLYFFIKTDTKNSFILGTVSYTHLDVYKRQLQKNMRDGWLPEKKIFIAGSY